MAYRLTGSIQHYAWGGYEYIPQLLHRPNEGHRPWAEYWLGAHDKSPSMVRVEDGGHVPLPELIRLDPARMLGPEVARRFGRLPFLLKVLDVRDMLSIQVHPSKREAEKGFAAEDRAGIPRDAPDRNYRDDNHKPEMMVALSEFYLLHGFRPPAELRQVLLGVPELRGLERLFDAEGYAGLYRQVMQWPQDRVTGLLRPLLERLLPAYRQGLLDKTQPDFWAARAVDSGISDLDQPDRGIFSIYFFNIVRLSPGEGIFQAAGIPHAYLEGQNVELMANSDNVLRGGLTPKHVDLEELLKHVRLDGVHPDVWRPGAGSADFPTPVPDFALSKIALDNNQSIDYQSLGPEIILVLSGRAAFRGLPSAGEELLAQGEALFIGCGEKYVLCASEKSLIFKASVPVREM